MPSPIGHTLAGLVTHVATAPRGDAWHRRRALLLVVMANAADADFALRLIDGQNHHQRFTHSVGFSVLAGLVALLVARRARLAWSVGAAWLTHVLLDWLGRDTNPPIGVQALWPFSQDFYKSPLIVFLDVGRQATWETVVNNAQAAVVELAVMVPVFVVAWRLRKRFVGDV